MFVVHAIFYFCHLNSNDTRPLLLVHARGQKREQKFLFDCDVLIKNMIDRKEKIFITQKNMRIFFLVM